MSDADRQNSPGEQEPRAVTPRSPRLFRRVIEVIPFILAIIGGVLLFEGHDAFHIVGGLAAIAFAFGGIVILLERTELPKRHRAIVVAISLWGIGYATWAVWPSDGARPSSETPESASARAARSAPRAPPERAPVAVGGVRQVSRSGHVYARPVVGPPTARLPSTAVSLTLVGRKLWFLTRDGFGYIKPADGMGVEQSLPFEIGASAIAASPSDLVITRRGVAYFRDPRSGHARGAPVRFSERGGPVALSGAFAWLLNQSHSKVDRVTLRSHTFAELSVPGVPTAVTVAKGFVWVVVKRGWLVRFSARRGTQVARRQIVRDPEAIIYGYGYLWVAHPALALVTRLDPIDGSQVGPAIYVERGVRALAVADGSIWAAGPRQIARIEPAGRRVSERLAVSGTVAMTGGRRHLFAAGSRKITQLPAASRSSTP